VLLTSPLTDPMLPVARVLDEPDRTAPKNLSGNSRPFA